MAPMRAASRAITLRLPQWAARRRQQAGQHARAADDQRVAKARHAAARAGSAETMVPPPKNARAAARIEDASLAGCDAFLGIEQLDRGGAAGQRVTRAGTGGRVERTLTAQSSAPGRIGQPVDVAQTDRARGQRRARADDDARMFGIEPDTNSGSALPDRPRPLRWPTV